MRSAALRQARSSVVLGLGVALFVTLFVDLTVLAVPIFDMQLYDRVLLSRNMDTVAMLAVACGMGLLLYGVFDYLRSAALVAIAEGVGRALRTPVLEAGVRHSLGGQAAAGGEALRDLNEIQGFLSSGAVSVPLDALCAPLLLAVMFMLHPAFGWMGVTGIALMVILGIVTDALVRPAVVAAATATGAGRQPTRGRPAGGGSDGGPGHAAGAHGALGRAARGGVGRHARGGAPV